MFVIFFMTTGPLLIYQVPARTSLDVIYYRDECLKVLVTRKDQGQLQMALTLSGRDYFSWKNHMKNNI